MSGIVVGVDGSTGSVRALTWAAGEARLRRTRLVIVSAWSPPVGLYADVAWAGIEPEVLTELRGLAESALARLCDEHADVLAGIDVERHVVQGAAASALVEAAERADLLVVGTRGHGGFAGLLLGSVSHQCAHHSPCPVVIVPSEPARKHESSAPGHGQRESGEEAISTHQQRDDEATPSGMTRLKTDRI